MRSALSAYGFVNAKLRARLSKRLPPETIERLVKARSLPEALQFLKGTDYEPLLTTYADTGDLALAEARLYAREVEAYAELRRHLSEPGLSMVRALSLRLELEQVKAATRLWFDARVRGRSIDGKSGYLYRGVIANAFDVDALVRAPNAEALAQALAKTPYAAPARETLPAAVAARSLLGFELALDRLFYDEALGAAARLGPRDRRIAERWLLAEIDAQNEARAARYALERLETSLEASLLPHGTAYRRLAGRARPGGSPAAAAQERGARAEALRNAARHEAAVRRVGAAQAERNLFGYPFSIGVVLAYLERRAEEARTVMTALNAKRYALSEERIRSLL